uniref:ARAD1A10978p n=1 Tax=Blastobotrys adeninivorans TaxID=409370 RepID=A0A060SYA7_BLAAD
MFKSLTLSLLRSSHVTACRILIFETFTPHLPCRCLITTHPLFSVDSSVLTINYHCLTLKMIELTHHSTSRDDLPKYTGPHTPSKNLEPYLKYLFPVVDDAQSNIFFCYREGRGFLSELEKYLRSHVHPRNSDVTIVIENGANATKSLDNKFESLGFGSKRTSGLYNCYQLMSESGEHSKFSNTLSHLIWSLVPPNFMYTIRSWGSGDEQLDGPIVHRLTNNQVSRNATIVKKPDFSFMPRYRDQISAALGQNVVPTFIGEVAKSQTADSLLMAAKSWLGGSMLLVESVLAVNLWRETLSIVFYQFDCRVENLLRLLGQFHESQWEAQCLRLVIRYKCLRWLIDLRLIMFLIEHQGEDFVPRENHALTAELQERFRDANRLIANYNDLLQGLGDTQTYTLAPERGLQVSLDPLIGHQEQIRDDIQGYEDILRWLPQADDEEGEIDLAQAVVTVSDMVFQQSLSPAAVLGPFTFNWAGPEHIQLQIPVSMMVGFTRQVVQLTVNDLKILAQDISWPIVELHSFSIQLPRIELGWIENPGSLARRKNTTVDELQQNLAHYLRGRINLGELTWVILGDTYNTLREVNDRIADQLENMNIGTKRYLLGIYRYLAHETFTNAPDTRDALEWTVRLQYYFRIVFQRLQRAAEEEQRAENERAGSAERAERAATERRARYERRVARREGTHTRPNGN